MHEHVWKYLYSWYYGTYAKFICKNCQQIKIIDINNNLGI